MKIIRLIVALIVVVLLTSCGNDQGAEVAKLKTELAGLRNELRSASIELDELKFGPARQLADVESSAKSSNWADAKKQAEALIAKHPAAAEVLRAREILAKAIEAIEIQEKKTAVADAKRQDEERRQKGLEERRLAVALSKMKKNVDQIEKITWYRDQSSPRHTNYNGFFLYIGKGFSGDPWLRLRIQYNADTWLFIESFLVVADGRRFERDSVKFERDNNSEIWEWYDDTANASDLEMVRAIIDSKNAVIRFSGDKYRRDRTITASEKAALRNVLDAYKVLGGT